MKSLLIISRLLDYPDTELRDHQDELLVAVGQCSELSPSEQQTLSTLIATINSQPLLDIQSEYCGLFDRGRATSLLLFEHVHGESRDRGQAMVNLLDQYQRAGLVLDKRELPDHLPLYLEYLSGCSREDAQQGLNDIAPILALLEARLKQRGVMWAILFSLLLALAPRNIDPAHMASQVAVEARDDTSQALDAVWEEEQVKFFADKGCDDGLVAQHQHRFAGAVAPQYLNVEQGGR